MSEAYIYDHLRTPRGKGKKDGSLHQVSPVWLLRTLLKALESRNVLDTNLVDDVVLAARAFVDACMVAHLKGELDAGRAALAKAWVSEQQCKVMDECLQLFGGYGYMMEYPIAELYVDARVQRIYGGTNEIMKELASRFM